MAYFLRRYSLTNKRKARSSNAPLREETVTSGVLAALNALARANDVAPCKEEPVEALLERWGSFYSKPYFISLSDVLSCSPDIREAGARSPAKRQKMVYVSSDDELPSANSYVFPLTMIPCLSMVLSLSPGLLKIPVQSVLCLPDCLRPSMDFHSFALLLS